MHSANEKPPYSIRLETIKIAGCDSFIRSIYAAISVWSRYNLSLIISTSAYYVYTIPYNCIKINEHIFDKCLKNAQMCAMLFIDTDNNCINKQIAQARKGAYMKRFYFVDTENIGKRFLPGAENLTSNDTIILFNYKYGPKLSMEVLSALSNCKASIVRKEMETHTKNAMDFQICTYLGMIVGTYQTHAEYYIFSEDKGYGAAIEFIEQSLEKKAVIKEVRDFNLSTKQGVLKANIDDMLGTYPKKVRRVAAFAIQNMHTDEALHNYLQKNLPKDGPTIYKLIKPYRIELAAS